ncbi:unnamed protein product [Parnassius mnemosyne]|uniref:Peptidase aspartic putative domain-containing protein n=1 Tax=Parnassius mnemosyne TaxID=213953 RepID=A0AAV1L8J0_9NEOP
MIDHKQNLLFAPVKYIVENNNINSFSSVVCRVDHRIYDCAKFKAKSVHYRISEVNKLRLCLNCLRYGHSVRHCRLGPCRECKKRHNTLLHIPLPSDKGSDKNVTTSCATISEETVVNFFQQNSTCVLLSTAIIEISNPNTNKSIRVRALLDCGSQSSFTTQSLKEKLSLQSYSNNVINIVGIGNNHTNKAIESCVAQLHSLTEPFKVNHFFLVLPELTDNIPKFPIDIQQLNIPNNIKLADPTFKHSAPIDIHIGAELFCKQITLGPNNPKLRSSKFGWLISGPYTNSFHKSNDITQCHLLATLSNSGFDYNNINTQMSKFWELEEVPLKHHLNPKEKACEAHFINHTFRLESGRFSVSLPLKDSPDYLGESYTLAKKRLLTLEKRFRKQPDVKLQYINFIRDQD